MFECDLVSLFSEGRCEIIRIDRPQRRTFHKDVVVNVMRRSSMRSKLNTNFIRALVWRTKADMCVKSTFCVFNQLERPNLAEKRSELFRTTVLTERDVVAKIAVKFSSVEPFQLRNQQIHLFSRDVAAVVHPQRKTQQAFQTSLATLHELWHLPVKQYSSNLKQSITVYEVEGVRCIGQPTLLHFLFDFNWALESTLAQHRDYAVSDSVISVALFPDDLHIFSEVVLIERCDNVFAEWASFALPGVSLWLSFSLRLDSYNIDSKSGKLVSHDATVLENANDTLRQAGESQRVEELKDLYSTKESNGLRHRSVRYAASYVALGGGLKTVIAQRILKNDAFNKSLHLLRHQATILYVDSWWNE